MSYPGIAEGFIDQGSSVVDNLIAGEFPRVVMQITVGGGVDYPAGAVIGEIDDEQLFVFSAAGAEDGSEIPEAVLAEPVDATQSPVQAMAYFSGHFNSQALTLGDGHTLETVRRAFRIRSIFLSANQA
ncbi:head decoration protein [Teredinibacter sp. KSP-S5-2]|uniref:head decoration protein n=1 Tax=Teredinibacter sp. KSP-S5-2 TaxID=3034506 RepID=UPI002934FC3F|nr:head decoration protein [Teredinibacter sp. KSP-S5-2]WNO10429.1 head decoration protein [Teredinibacter sp. KSP-S5-2]